MQPTVTFSFERPGMPVPSFSLSLSADGIGEYRGTEVYAPARPSDPAPAAQPFQRLLALSAPTVAKIFAAARELHMFNLTCASNAKHIADTGRKTLAYTGPDGAGRCTFNYAEDKAVRDLTDIFFGIAQTMDMGRRIDHMHRFDRLGLDAELASLATLAKEGNALELSTIAPSLHAVLGDNEVLQRARSRAQALLETIPVEVPQSSAPVQ